MSTKIHSKRLERRFICVSELLAHCLALIRRIGKRKILKNLASKSRPTPFSLGAKR
uniref:Uncharacterized protein n=1 Tax=Candidatus Kentrum sp. LFY TaxID=2126342 RepID=A0A450WVS8_9GAMM|nr:MAG: hypothetical protein BECKLFY1418B_GA0070995_102326 [Candidatus Kentron sp. LFY]VFJ92147.1 MAG: hypothetical protein BECKLFY1418A_GA0070994_102110 [Candidatus Kentron sp. LFY]VFK21151.1 MAG: hypothetical protein BECKLFY1418C_GA0070996_108616 [Candidatus Kentron sp. LFY]